MVSEPVSSITLWCSKLHSVAPYSIICFERFPTSGAHANSLPLVQDLRSAGQPAPSSLYKCERAPWPLFHGCQSFCAPT